jgi:hypothetical protein
MLAYHAILNTLLFFGLVGYSPIYKITGRWLFYPLVLHILISLYLYIKEKLRKSKNYPKLTRETTQQLVSGIGIILFAAMHILNYSLGDALDSSQFLYNILADNLLFISIAIHLHVSIPRLLVSFGFLEGKNTYKNAKHKIGISLLIILIIIFMAQATFYGGFL